MYVTFSKTIHTLHVQCMYVHESTMSILRLWYCTVCSLYEDLHRSVCKDYCKQASIYTQYNSTVAVDLVTGNLFCKEYCKKASTHYRPRDRAASSSSLSSWSSLSSSSIFFTRVIICSSGHAAECVSKACMIGLLM